MSIIVCDGCDAYIDSDFDCDCFVEVGNERRQHQTKIYCERCREEVEWQLDYTNSLDKS